MFEDDFYYYWYVVFGYLVLGLGEGILDGVGIGDVDGFVV